jgi:predicted kinase
MSFLPRKLLTIICGNAGVGKTTFARQLARREGALLLDIDTASELLVRAGLEALEIDPDDRDSPRYKRLYRKAIHDTLLALADDNLSHQSCIIVAPFTQERRDPHFLERVRVQLRTDVRIFYLVCDEETRRKRIQKRKNPRDRAKLKDWGNYSKSGLDVTPPPFPHHLIDTAEED